MNGQAVTPGAGTPAGSSESRSDPSVRRAAVLVPLVRGKDGPAILMEVRSQSVWQPGEICFPGGHVEEGETILRTALRETQEELGIPPASVRLLKEMEPEAHGGRSMDVYPVLAEIAPFTPEDLALQKEEVAEIFALPLSWLLGQEPAFYDISDPESPDMPRKLKDYLAGYPPIEKNRTTPYWEYGPYGIWGLTARILVKVRDEWKKDAAHKQ